MKTFLIAVIIFVCFFDMWRVARIQNEHNTDLLSATTALREASKALGTYQTVNAEWAEAYNNLKQKCGGK